VSSALPPEDEEASPAAPPDRPLRRGWTTGACATAAAAAAYEVVLGGELPDPVTIELPGGKRPSFAVAMSRAERGSVTVGIVKDAGDDPDATHGALVWVRVSAGEAGAGVTFRAGEGVGTVTLPGLPLAVGEPAINPAPRRMIAEALARVAAAHAGRADTGAGSDSGAGSGAGSDSGAGSGAGSGAATPPDVVVEVGVQDGAEIAKRTWNPRLGIVGGLSILGTTGVVIPYSCSAWIASIRQGIDVAVAAGHRHVIAATGETSERAAQERYGLPQSALLDMGDFAGAVLSHLARHPIPRLTLAGGFAKLSKLAAGHLDLHSARSQVDLGRLASVAGRLGAPQGVVREIASAKTALHALELAQAAGVPLAGAVAADARATAVRALSGAPVDVDVLVVDRAGRVVGGAGPE
jgi:cobalt-precorrin-5B (C1)-methyltransferase